MGGNLHIGFEHEFGGIHLVKYSRHKGKYDLKDIAYGEVIARTAGEKTIAGSAIPFGEIQVEGSEDHSTHGIIEHVGAPFRPGGSRFEAQRNALVALTGALEDVMEDESNCLFKKSFEDQTQEFLFFKLSHVIKEYNKRLAIIASTNDTMVNGSSHSIAERIIEFRMTTVGSHWAVAKKKLNFGNASLQTNVEVPFLSIGQENGLPLGIFDPRTENVINACRNQAEIFVTNSLNFPGDTSALRSMFTLFYFSLYIQWENERAAAKHGQAEKLAAKLFGGGGVGESSSSSAKSRWCLLPKVTWEELWDNALDDAERQIIKDKRPMIAQTRVQQVSNICSSDAVKKLATCPFRMPSGAFDEGWLREKYRLFFTYENLGGAVLSSTGKPLPVVDYPKSGQKRNPVIVFEVRNSGADWNHSFKELRKLSVDFRELLKVITQGQSTGAWQ